MAKPLTQTVGRRKSSVARVQLRDGTGTMTLNERALENYFPNMAQRIRVLEPMRVAGVEGRYDVTAPRRRWPHRAVRCPPARYRQGPYRPRPRLCPVLKKAGMLTRDSRAVERKKYGLRGRRAEQFTKH